GDLRGETLVSLEQFLEGCLFPSRGCRSARHAHAQNGYSFRCSGKPTLARMTGGNYTTLTTSLVEPSPWSFPWTLARTHKRSHPWAPGFAPLSPVWSHRWVCLWGLC